MHPDSFPRLLQHDTAAGVPRVVYPGQRIKQGHPRKSISYWAGHRGSLEPTGIDPGRTHSGNGIALTCPYKVVPGIRPSPPVRIRADAAHPQLEGPQLLPARRDRPLPAHRRLFGEPARNVTDPGLIASHYADLTPA